jgi:hypothetical protein
VKDRYRAPAIGELREPAVGVVAVVLSRAQRGSANQPIHRITRIVGRPSVASVTLIWLPSAS